jgi:hypothetical protein
MGPSQDDTTGTGHDQPDDLELEASESVDEIEAEPEPADDADDDEYDDDDEDDEEDDGLAPEAGSRRPSLMSLLLLVAGAIWIVVAMLKLTEPEQPPGLAIGDQAAEQDSERVETGATLPGLDDEPLPDARNPEPADSQLPHEPADSPEKRDFVENPELAPEVDVGTPASERGPPVGSLLAGKRWPQDYAAPDVVTYTIKRGGSMKVVANLYKIFHHEIEALNPGVSLERELPPSTKIVVWRRKPGVASQSVGYPGAGSLEGAMPMVDGPGRLLRHTPWKAWATQTTVATIDLVLREWARRYPSEQVIIVGNLSARNGGRLQPHSSHQSGRDVDLSYPQIWDHKSELAPQVMNERNLERNLTWALLELLVETGAVEHVFIDTKLQKLLFEFALETQRYDEQQLKNWMEYPSPAGSGSPIIQHVPGHVDHLHVRFKCTPSETRCGSRDL